MTSETFLKWVHNCTELFQERIFNVKGAEETQKFELRLIRLSSNKARVKYVLRDSPTYSLIAEIVDEMLLQLKHETTKSAQKATKALKEGDGFYQNQDFEGSLQMFNEAISWAPDPETDPLKILAIVLEKRALVFFELQQYSEAVEDIDDALSLGLAPERCPLLLYFKIKSLVALNRIEDALKVAAEAEKFVKSNVKTVGTPSMYWISSFNQCLDYRTLSLHGEETEGHGLLNANPLLPQASDSLTMGFKPSKGRLMLTTRVVEESELLLVDKPFLTILYTNSVQTHCHFCCKPLLNRFVPCFRCSSSKYCSFHCKNQAWHNYHRIECAFEPIHKYLGFGILAIRALLVEGVETALRVEEDAPKSRSQWTRRVFSNNYRSFYSLKGHVNHFPPHKVFWYTFGAAVLLVLSDKLSLFNQSVSGTGKVYYRVGGLLLRHLLQINTNAVRIYEEGTDKDYDESGIGFGVYCTWSLFNHSCECNAEHNYRGNEIRVTAKESIKRGREVTVSYGPNNLSHSLTERRKHLANGYNFKCQCNACKAELKSLKTCLSCGKSLISLPFLKVCLKCSFV